MSRTSKWAANTEMWQYAADLVYGGKTYSQVHDELSLFDVKKRLGLLDVPHPDTIRYQIKQQGLLKKKRSSSALYPEDLKTHESGLFYLALVLRGQSSVPEAPETGSGTDKHRPDKWIGFLPGGRYVRFPEDTEEHEVSDEWTSGMSDPRELSHFGYLIEHLELSTDGKKIIQKINAVFDRAEDYSAASEHLWDVLHEDLAAEHQVESGDPNLEKRCGDIFDALHPTSRLPDGKESLRLELSIDPTSRPIKGSDYGIPEVFQNHRGGASHIALIKAWVNLDVSAEKLERIMTPSSGIRRLIQDGQCSICAYSNE